MKNEKIFSGTKLILVAVLLFLSISMILSSCTCPVYSLIGKLIGVKIRAGEDIDESVVENELIYPGSTLLMQAESDMGKIFDTISKYGADISEKELESLEQLPDEIKEQELIFTVYSTPDTKSKVLYYYSSFESDEWEIMQLQTGQQVNDESGQTILVASSTEDKQLFALSAGRDNTLIIFLEIDLEALSGL